MRKARISRGRGKGHVQLYDVSMAHLLLLACGWMFFLSSLTLWKLQAVAVKQQQQRAELSLFFPGVTDTSIRDKSQLHIFYHMFLPKPSYNNRTAYQAALAVVDEHVTQITHNLLQKTNYTTDASTVYFHYTTVGARLPREGYLENKYSHGDVLKFVHVQHVDEGFEEYSLQALYDHCQRQPHGDKDNTWVVYLHSKGTFHNTRENVNFRRALTNAVLHQDCLAPNVEHCNVCSLQFVPFPIHVAGNMWTASCNYVRQLLPPVEFRPRIEAAAQKIMRLERQGRLQILLSAFSNTMLGTRRYSNQHWIGTHPNVVPCQVASPDIRLEHWRQLSAGDFNYTSLDGIVDVLPPTGKIHKRWWKKMASFHGIVAPALPLDKLTIKWMKDMKRVSNITDRRKEITLLPGLFQYWDSLYNGSRPSNNSWFWDYYPDGDYFRNHPHTQW